MLTRHLKEAERHLAESEAHVQFHLDHFRGAQQRGWNVEPESQSLRLAKDMRLMHGQRVALLRAELGLLPEVSRELQR